MNNEKLLIEELDYVQKEVNIKGKKSLIAYIFLFLLGPFGAHYAYLESPKYASGRATLSVATIAMLYPIYETYNFAITQDITKEMEQKFSVLLVMFGLMIIAQIVWFLYDLAKIPEIAQKFNEKVEDEAKEKILQARNVVARIREEEISQIVIERVTENVMQQLEKQKEVAKEEETLKVLPTEEVEKAIPVNEALSLDRGNITVEGYIVGSMRNGVKVTKDNLISNDNSILIAENPEETDVSKMFIVQIPQKRQKHFGLKTNPNNKGKKIIVNGSVRKYYGAFGLRDISSINIVE